MFEILSILCLSAGFVLLVILSIIDLKTFLLPNVFVAPFALLGLAFHYFTDFYFLTFNNVILGGIVGFGILYIIRYFGNLYYGQDSLGLGDVKLLGAGGLWLGYEGVLFAMTIGAFAGLVHGIIYALYQKIKNGGPLNFRKLIIPAGPGFAVGIIIVAIWMYHSHVISTYFSLIQ